MDRPTPDPYVTVRLTVGQRYAFPGGLHIIHWRGYFRGDHVEALVVGVRPSEPRDYRTRSTGEREGEED